MPTRLLGEFLTQDCDAASRERLLAEIGKHGVRKVDVRREYTFNRFTLKLDFQKQEVILEDELDVGDEGSCRLQLREFTSALQQHDPNIGASRSYLVPRP